MLKAKRAMALLEKNKRYCSKEIQRCHFNDMAAKFFNRSDSEPLVKQMPARVLCVMSKGMGQRVTAGFPMWPSCPHFFAGLHRAMVKA